MIDLKRLRAHVLDAAEEYDLPLSVRQAETLTNYLAVHATRIPGSKITLTDVQHAVLVGLASGETASETAHRVGRSLFTVKSHRSTLYAALGARSAAHAVSIAITSGLLLTPQSETASEDEAR
ncbi:LuxR C-terminal-related transcriptional regulator [Streptomyces sp. NPDC001635]